jgi:beta-lactamase class A
MKSRILLHFLKKMASQTIKNLSILNTMHPKINILAFISILLFLLQSCSSQPELSNKKNNTTKKQQCRLDKEAIQQLEKELRAICDTADGKIGIAICFEASNTCININADSLFPLASVYKVPIVAAYLAKAEREGIDIDSILTLRYEDRRYSGCFMDDSTHQSTYRISGRELARLALQQSDNCASDALLRQAGGPAAVRTQLKAWDLEGVAVNRYLIQILGDLLAYPMPQDENLWTYHLATKMILNTSFETASWARQRFHFDPRDQASPLAAVAMMQSIYYERLLTAENSIWLKETMQGCRTGRMYLPKSLTEGICIGRKTGSLFGIMNDAGWMQKPDGQGLMFYAVFSKGSRMEYEERAPIMKALMEKIVKFKPMYCR